jgi:hypothetical protein
MRSTSILGLAMAAPWRPPSTRLLLRRYGCAAVAGGVAVSPECAESLGLWSSPPGDVFPWLFLILISIIGYDGYLVFFHMILFFRRNLNCGYESWFVLLEYCICSSPFPLPVPFMLKICRIICTNCTD